MPFEQKAGFICLKTPCWTTPFRLTTPRPPSVYSSISWRFEVPSFQMLKSIIKQLMSNWATSFLSLSSGFDPHLLHSSVSQVWDSRLVFLAALPANLYANEKIIINEVHAWLAPINTTLHQQTILMATFHTARQLGGVLMWWSRP